MSAEQFRRTIQQSISVALKKRVGTGTGLTVKQLAYSLRVDQQTVWKLLNGYNAPSGPVLMALIAFFDCSFANEILEPAGCQVAKIGDARSHALRKVAEGMAELRKLG
jgi:transcriptional regulator with XRE-family HTH domain